MSASVSNAKKLFGQPYSSSPKPADSRAVPYNVGPLENLCWGHMTLGSTRAGQEAYS